MPVAESVTHGSTFSIRRNPLFDGVTTGVVAGSEFFYMTNVQDDKKTGFNPITILKPRSKTHQG